jgi:hypothetical protein
MRFSHLRPDLQSFQPKFCDCYIHIRATTLRHIKQHTSRLFIIHTINSPSSLIGRRPWTNAPYVNKSVKILNGKADGIYRSEELTIAEHFTSFTDNLKVKRARILRRMPSSAMWCSVALVRTVLSKKYVASIIRVERISELGTLAVTSCN